MKSKFSSMWRVAIALVMVLSLGLVMAAPVSAQGALTDVSATPTNSMAETTTDYEVAFTTASIAVVGSVDMEFDAAFDVSSAVFSSKSGTIGDGTVSVSGQVVTYTVTTPASIDPGITITITLDGIVNPSTAATYSPGVTVTTRYTNDNPIDEGTADVTITPLPVSFLVVTENAGTEIAGAAFTVTVTAKDGAGGTGSTVTDYVGNHFIYFSSTATDSPTIPTFELLDFVDGVKASANNFILTNAGETPTITATDEAFESDITGTSAEITVNAGTLHHLTITGAPTSVVAGVAFSADVTVTAEDAYGNVITGYMNTVTWSGGGGGASLPAPYPFVVGDAGVHAFPGSEFILSTVGSQIIIVEDTDTTIAGEAPITVTAPASKLVVTPDAGSITADGFESLELTATVQDEFDNTATSYSADITFHTSLGGFTEADGASTYTVAAVDEEGVAAGVATANLTSTDVGVATIKVTSGSLTYDTALVTLIASDPTEVWVDSTYTNDGNDGGHDWEFDAWDTIQEGIDNVAAGGTVNVAPGTYNNAGEGLPIEVNVAGLTLQSTGTAEETIIDCEATYNGINIIADDVTVDGFTVLNSQSGTSNAAAIEVTGLDAIVINNIMTAAAGWPEGIALRSDGAHVSGNDLDSRNTMMLFDVSDCMVSENTFDAGINVQARFTPVTGITITDNDIIGSGATGIVFEQIYFPLDDVLIEDNTISEIELGSGDDAAISFRSTTNTVTNLRITGNDITDNEGVGIVICTTATWGAGNTIDNNNISGNIVSGIENKCSEVVNAENNWWGDETGPYQATTNSAGTGDEVSVDVDYRPWLDAPEPSAPVTTIELAEGWNFISVPRTMATDTDTFTELLDGIVYTIAWSYDPYTPDGWVQITSENEDVEVLEGYWINVTTAGTVALSYTEEGRTVPPTKQLKGDAWNAVGPSSTTAQSAEDVLKSIEGSWSTLIGWDADGQAYEDAIIAPGAESMTPGKGYWIWVTEDDVLSAISG